MLIRSKLKSANYHSWNLLFLFPVLKHSACISKFCMKSIKEEEGLINFLERKFLEIENFRLAASYESALSSRPPLWRQGCCPQSFASRSTKRVQFRHYSFCFSSNLLQIGWNDICSYFFLKMSFWLTNSHNSSVFDLDFSFWWIKCRFYFNSKSKYNWYLIDIFVLFVRALHVLVLDFKLLNPSEPLINNIDAFWKLEWTLASKTK